MPHTPRAGATYVHVTALSGFCMPNRSISAGFMAPVPAPDALAQIREALQEFPGGPWKSCNRLAVTDTKVICLQDCLIDALGSEQFPLNVSVNDSPIHARSHEGRLPF